jgi:hypothetical protein
MFSNNQNEDVTMVDHQHNLHNLAGHQVAQNSRGEFSSAQLQNASN